MRPNCCLAILRVSVCAALLLTLDADSEDSECEFEVKVDRNTVYEAFLGEDLRIHCTVEFCSDSPPPVSWYKQRRNDSGAYWCRVGGSVSHNINVYVHGEGTTVSLTSVHGGVVTSEPGTEDTSWSFVYRAVGITVFFITMLTVCVASRRMYKGKCRATPSRQPSHDALPPSHNHENSQPCIES